MSDDMEVTTQQVDQQTLLSRVAGAVQIPGISERHVHFGFRYQASDEPQARALRTRDGGFDWLAYSFGEISMWTLHVGVVLTENGIDTGLHIASSAPRELMEVVSRVGTWIGGRSVSDTAQEIQFNRMPRFSQNDFLGIATFLSDAYVKTEHELTRDALLASSNPGRHEK